MKLSLINDNGKNDCYYHYKEECNTSAKTTVISIAKTIVVSIAMASVTSSANTNVILIAPLHLYRTEIVIDQLKLSLIN